MSIYSFNIWDTGKVTAGYTTDFCGLFRYHHPDDVSHYSAICKTFGLDAGRMVRVHQYHTDRIAVVDASNGGEGVLREGPEEGTDAMITDTGNLMLSIITADCVPVFLYDEASHSIGLVHSGRQGTGKEIAYLTALKMQQQYGADPKEIRCILGPYLCRHHHEVRQEDIAPFMQRFSRPEREKFITASGEKAYVDMGGAIEISLLRAGLQRENIFNCGICTYEHPELFSWRKSRNPETHILSFLALKG